MKNMYFANLKDVISVNETYIDKLYEYQVHPSGILGDLLDDVASWLQELNLVLDAYDQALDREEKLKHFIAKLP